MGYFSNSTEGMMFEEQYCHSCVHRDDDLDSFGCPVWMLHMMWNYDAVGMLKDETKETALESFIPTEGIENKPCTMRHTTVDPRIHRYAQALAGIAQASFCRDPNCTADDPHCDAMIAKATLEREDYQPPEPTTFYDLLAELHDALDTAWKATTLPASVIAADLVQRVTAALARKDNPPDPLDEIEAHVSIVYDTITNGLISKWNTHSDAVIAVHEDEITKLVSELVEEALTEERQRISTELKTAAARAEWVASAARNRRHGTMLAVFDSKAKTLLELATWLDAGAELQPWNVEDGEPDHE